MEIILLFIGLIAGVFFSNLYFNKKNKNFKSKFIEKDLKFKKLKKKEKNKKIKGEKGKLFELFIIKKFNFDFFKLERWNSDNFFIDSNDKKIYPNDSHYPDLELIFSINSKNIEQSIAIECKWRKSLFQEGVCWCKTYQFENYKKFQNKRQIPVFLVIGIGGEPSLPKELFIIPIININSSNSKEIIIKNKRNQFIHKDFLMKFRKNIRDNFFFNSENNNLS